VDWSQFLILFLTFVGIFLTLRSDSQKYERDLKEFREKWSEESKDFHGRLIAIEERRNKILFKE
jgi:hypothetical protein